MLAGVRRWSAGLALIAFAVTPETLFAAGHFAEDHLHALETTVQGVMSIHTHSSEEPASADARIASGEHDDHEFADRAGSRTTHAPDLPALSAGRRLGTQSSDRTHVLRTSSPAVAAAACPPPLRI